MKSHFRVVVLTFAAVGPFAAIPARAQAADSLTKGKSDGSIVVASAPDTVVKKKGMFGKLKGVAHNKTVQNITKAAVCQALPGGQYMVGAAEAAKNKTSISSGAANAQSCIPGMGGAGAGMGGVGGLGAKGAIAGAAMGAAGSIGTGGAGKPVAGSTRGASVTPGMPGMPAGAMAGFTPEQMQQMQAMSASMGGTGGIATEAAGEQMKLSGPIPEEIKKGKLTIKKIDWVHGSANVSPSTTQGFVDLIISAAQAMKAEGGNYRVDVYMDKKYSDEEIASIGAQRMMVLVNTLQSSGQLTDAVVSGKIGKDKEQRVEIAKVK